MHMKFTHKKFIAYWTLTPKLVKYFSVWKEKFAFQLSLSQ